MCKAVSWDSGLPAPPPLHLTQDSWSVEGQFDRQQGQIADRAQKKSCTGRNQKSELRRVGGKYDTSLQHPSEMQIQHT